MKSIKELKKESIIDDSISSSRPEDKPYFYMYSILRTDIDMPIGKLLAQSGHAFSDSLKSAEINYPEIYSNYRVWSNEEKTAFNGGAKVCMKAKNADQLIKAYNIARNAGIPCALIVDKGHILPPHFDGNPIITALGIGPCSQEDAKQITKRFTCF